MNLIRRVLLKALNDYNITLVMWEIAVAHKNIFYRLIFSHLRLFEMLSIKTTLDSGVRYLYWKIVKNFHKIEFKNSI